MRVLFWKLVFYLLWVWATLTAALGALVTVALTYHAVAEYVVRGGGVPVEAVVGALVGGVAVALVTLRGTRHGI